ncbi:MAG: hypothetical protein RI988_1610 [Pseudomonadota bacterium]|jgi:DNA ligase-associated metallophosphoesterase
MALTLEVGGQPLVLLPERAAFVPAASALLVADAHFGKAQSFRRLGVPVPEATTADNLRRLTHLLAHTGAAHLVFLGDLMHARDVHGAAAEEEVARWRAGHAALRITLVEGNHDAKAGAPPARWGIERVPEPLLLGTLALRHHPQPEAGRYVLAGHLHPAAWVGRGVQRLRLPCFHFGAQVGVLPAFGSFTGMHPVQPQPGDRLFVAAEDAVRELPLGAAAGVRPARVRLAQSASRGPVGRA